MDFSRADLVAGDPCRCKRRFHGLLRGGQLGRINGWFGDILFHLPPAFHFNGFGCRYAAALQARFRNDRDGRCTVGNLGTIKYVKVIHKRFAVGFHHGQRFEVFDSIVIFLRRGAEPGIFNGVAEPPGQGLACLVPAIFFKVGTGPVAELPGEEIGMTILTVFKPPGTGQEVGAVDRLDRILNLHANHQNDVGGFGKHALDTAHQRQSARSAGSLDPDGGLVAQSLIHVWEKGGQVGLPVETRGHEIADHTFINIGRPADHVQGALPGFADILLQPGTFLFRVELLTAGTH